MKEFKVGQVVRVLRNDNALAFNLDHERINLIGMTFIVEELDDEEAVVVNDNGKWFVPPGACELVIDNADVSYKTPFQRVAEMNTAFGNPKGDFQNIDWERIRAQVKNIHDEYCETLAALGLSKYAIGCLKKVHELMVIPAEFTNVIRTEEVRDGLADIQVFKDGALHLMGVDGDADIHAVIDGVMTRFIKDDADKEATIALHASKGVTDVYFEGEYPKMVMKSASDQPDAPKGKFLKSASYTNTIFPEVK